MEILLLFATPLVTYTVIADTVSPFDRSGALISPNLAKLRKLVALWCSVSVLVVLIASHQPAESVFPVYMGTVIVKVIVCWIPALAFYFWKRRFIVGANLDTQSQF